MTKTAPRVQTLAEHCVRISAGCEVDYNAVQYWELDLATLRRLANAYQQGWLSNVMGRITPITMRRDTDYLMMADLFIQSEMQAHRLLEKYQTDLELFCQMSGIQLLQGMTCRTVSSELRNHLDLYMKIAELLAEKFGFEVEDPLQALIDAPVGDVTFQSTKNEFVCEFLDQVYPGRRTVVQEIQEV